MKVNKHKILHLLFFLAGIILLQQGISFSNLRVSFMGKHSRVVVEKDIDPSALFYMESDLALAAEKNIRDKLK